MTAAPHIVTRRIEAERVRLENVAVNAAAAVGRTALRHAASAVRVGADPVVAAQAVLWGNPALGLPGLETLLARALVTAHLTGLRRTTLAVQQHAGRRDVLGLSRAEDKLGAWMRALAAKAHVGEAELTGIFGRARNAARRIIQKISAPLLRRVAGVARDAATGKAMAADTGVPQTLAPVMRELTVQFRKAGFLPGAEHGIGPEVSAEMVRAYESGRARGWRIPAVRERLWGFHYSSILDDVTTNLCRGLDGTTLPADDPFWQQWTPPNHFGCRSCVIEAWQSSQLREPPAFIRSYAKFGPDFFIG